MIAISLCAIPAAIILGRGRIIEDEVARSPST
jgi:hypothetical protein